MECKIIAQHSDFQESLLTLESEKSVSLSQQSGYELIANRMSKHEIEARDIRVLLNDVRKKISSLGQMQVQERDRARRI